MKSYLAKLATRATLANAPASSPASASKIQDPFADTLASDTSPSPLAATPPRRDPSQFAQSIHSQPPTRSEERSHSQIEKVDSDTSRKNEERSTSLNDPVRLTPTVERVSEINGEPTRRTEEGRPPGESRQSELSSVHEPPQLIARENAIPPAATPPVTKEISESKPTTETNTGDQLAELEYEQSVLLRKADAFMAGLFQRRSAVAQREADTEDEKQEPSESVALPEQLRRMQPAPQPLPITQIVDEQPSLVIGKLTVEITPPAPPPAATPRHVVVVRGGGGVRRGGFQSSKRFGLGQF